MSSALTLFLILSVIFLQVKGEENLFRNVFVERRVDLTTQIVQEVVKLKIEKTSEKFDILENFYHFVVPNNIDDTLSSLNAFDQTGVPLVVVKEKDSQSNQKYQTYFISLGHGLEVGQTYEFSLTILYAHRQIPTHQSKRQGENQIMSFTDSVNFYSKYQTLSEKTSFKLWSTSLDKNSRENECHHRGDIVDCGPFYETNSLTFLALTLTYHTEVPFISINHLKRDIEISHWGKVHIKERYSITHRGTKHKGENSRWAYDYLSQQSLSLSSVSSLSLHVPFSSKNFYYQDQFGNISSSYLSLSSSLPSSYVSSSPLAASPVLSSLSFSAAPSGPTENDNTHKVLTLSFRYPLEGSQSVSFELGYEVSISTLINQHTSSYFSSFPSSYFLPLSASSTNPSLYSSSLSSGSSSITTGSSLYSLVLSPSPLFDQPIPIDHLELSVTLPEGSGNVEVASTLNSIKGGKSGELLTSSSKGLTDFYGKGVAQLHWDKVIVSSHDFMVVYYSWNIIYLLLDWLLLFSMYFTFFVFLIALRRMKVFESSKESRNDKFSRIEETIRWIKALLEEINSHLQSVEDHFQKTMKNKTNSLKTFQDEKEALKRKIFIITKTITQIAIGIASEDAIISQKIRKLKLVKEKRVENLLNNYQNELEFERKLIKKNDYEIKKSEVEEELEELNEQYNRLLSDLMD